ncbi:MAG: exosortase/archaeosortase family protein [Planctomycetes bacterium]|nr:exosortase/archaeosortase family protein [Planctomycetota bacterium]
MRAPSKVGTEAPAAQGGEGALGAERSVRAFLRRNAAAVALAIAAYAVLFGPTLQGLARYWAEDPDFSHGFLIPVIALAIVFSSRGTLGAVEARGSAAGLAVLAAAVAVYFAGSITNTNLLERLGAWGAFLGGLWFLLGPELLRRRPLAFALLFLLLAIPPPYLLLSPLRLELKSFATRLSADVLGLLGYPALPEGNVLALGDQRLEVADACSGIRSLMAIVTTAILFAYLFRTGWWKGVTLTAAAVPITVAVNVLRILVIAVSLATFEMDLTSGAQHEALGYAVFGASLLLLYGSWKFVDWLFRWRPVERPA